MADMRGKFSKITWNANTLTFPDPLDSAMAFSKPRPGYEVAVADSGSRDAWSVGVDYFLRAVVRRIPQTNTVTVFGHTATGWEGATGWGAFLAWAWDMNSFTFTPDVDTPGTTYTCQLIAPSMEDAEPELEEDSTRRLPILLMTTNSSPILGY